MKDEEIILRIETFDAAVTKVMNQGGSSSQGGGSSTGGSSGGGGGGSRDRVGIALRG